MAVLSPSAFDTTDEVGAAGTYYVVDTCGVDMPARSLLASVTFTLRASGTTF